MSNPSKEPRNLKRTVDAILQLTREKTRREVSVKSIRFITKVDAGNRSVVAFYSIALIFLEGEGILRVINHSSPKKYVVIDEEKLKSLVEV